MSELFGYQVFTKSRTELILELCERIKKNNPASIVSLNTLKLYQGSKQSELKKLFNSADYIIPDGQSIVIAEKLIHNNKIEAISGAELMVELIKESESKGYRIFFLGSTQKLLDKVKNKIKMDFPKLINKVSFQHGYYDKRLEEKVILKKIASFKPDFLFVAFGSPRKEEFIIENQSLLNSNILMGVGGSYEYFVGDVQLDSFTKKLGIRWLVRTMQDPLRLTKRYLVCNSYFLKELIRELLIKKEKLT
jgi:N-acetylglucosaminyldiphosphoundecaprenol N-acetyl-beta-D-mannosaminyltransferase